MSNSKTLKQYKQKIKWLWNSRVEEVKTGEVGYVGYITDEGIELEQN